MHTENGELFWKNFRECTVVLNREFLTALQECIPINDETESQQTRLKVCSDPPLWAKMMSCLNDQLISLQNPEVELAPGAAYRTCVNVLISEFQDQDFIEMPFLLGT
ncbi:uncharacterized protein LOC118197159 isoform X3 [Stegodyphus dumicola]|uniref:uncharacterized protein LOC118197159 isoform X3 n=1 Tax=Stegodyphus dumicola TaxID=202533 RepID=UPI0015A9D8E2|nr:uncharacterized protein LOC118197159 isoform X3 [Stegodyphus dumicola]